MAHNLTPSPADPVTPVVTVPDGGDARTAASVGTPFQQLLNHLMWVYGVLKGTISSAINFLGSLQVHGTAHFYTTTLVDGDFQATNSFTTIGPSSMGDRVYMSAGGVNSHLSTLSAVTGSQVVNTDFANFLYLISTTGAYNINLGVPTALYPGARYEIYCAQSTALLTIKDDQSGATLCTMQNDGVHLAFASFFCNASGNWKLCASRI